MKVEAGLSNRARNIERVARHVINLFIPRIYLRDMNLVNVEINFISVYIDYEKYVSI